MSAQIYYFSGTGNSLRVASELARAMPGSELAPMVGALRRGALASSAEVVGLVFPIYAFDIPGIVAQFLGRADLTSASYIFAFATRYGTSRVFKRVDGLLAGKGKRLGGLFSVQAPENYIPTFEMPTEAEVARFDAELPAAIGKVKEAVESRLASEPREAFPLTLLTRGLFPIIHAAHEATNYFGMAKAFYADGKCVGCGTCASVCPSARIGLADERPRWERPEACLYCLACLQFCPAHAIQLKGRKTASRGRYHHPSITALDIARQKL